MRRVCLAARRSRVRFRLGPHVGIRRPRSWRHRAAPSIQSWPPPMRGRWGALCATLCGIIASSHGLHRHGVGGGRRSCPRRPVLCLVSTDHASVGPRLNATPDSHPHSPAGLHRPRVGGTTIEVDDPRHHYLLREVTFAAHPASRLAREFEV
jgi:hypothetical protein